MVGNIRRSATIEEEKLLVLVTYDESIFSANYEIRKAWKIKKNSLL